MAKFSFEVCQLGQVDELVNYIDNHWAKDHVLVTSRELLDWQHKSNNGSYYNFVLARHNKTGEVCGVLGFIPTSHFSKRLEEEKEVWLAIWKVNEGPKYIGLGLGLLNFLKREFTIKNICSIGISQIVFPMYQALGFEVGQLAQLALINTELDSYDLAQVPKEYKAPRLMREPGYQTRFIEEGSLSEQLSDTQLFRYKTQKDADYFLTRYMVHPKFKYRFLGIYQNESLVAFMVTRTVECNQRTVLRVVDAQGDLVSIAKVSGFLFDVLVSERHEYLDIMQYGMNELELIDAGFIKVGDDENIIVPDYFQPFVQKNISIFFARQSSQEEEHFMLFKGDADQDRPNIM